MLLEMSDCEICGNKDLPSVLDLGFHPLCDDLVPIGDTRVCEEYPIEILFCDQCITAHQRFQVTKQALFPQTYHYRSRNTEDVLVGMQQIVQFSEKNCGNLIGKKVLDIGCNDGSLLSFFREKGTKTYGIEPTQAFKDAIKLGHDVINDFFCETTAIDFVNQHGLVDIITFTNVFAHIEDLQKIIVALKIVMHAKTVLIIENHYLGAIIEKFQFDTFYHEHPRTYSFTSFSRIAEAMDMSIDDVVFPSRYNGNIRVALVPKNRGVSTHQWDEIYERERYFASHLQTMGKKIAPWCQKKHSVLKQLVQKYGKLSAKAFPGRAAILVKMLKLDTSLIKATYEKSQSNKINYYIPGTRIPILSDDDFDLLENTAPLLNLAWHISSEIKLYLQKRGYHGPIIDILSRQEIEFL